MTNGGTNPGGAPAPAHWSIEKIVGIVAAAGVVMSSLLGLAYAYSYNRLGVGPSSVGLSAGDLLLDAAGGLGFLALFVLLPLSVLVGVHTATLGAGLGKEKATPFTPTDALRTVGVAAASAVLAFVGRKLPESVIDVGVPLLVGAFIAGVLIAAGWSSPRLEGGLSRSCWRAILDVSFAELAALASLIAAVPVLVSVPDRGSDGLVAADVGSGALALAVLLFVQARRWSKRFRRGGEYRPGRMMGLRAPVASLLVVAFWMVVALYSDTLHYAGRVAEHGEASLGLPARLRTGAMTCVRLEWLAERKPGIPEHALHLGEAGGMSVFYVAGQGPMRLPSGQVATLPAGAERCRAP